MFPSQADVGIYVSSSAAADHSANYPTVVNPDQLLFYMAGCDGTGDTPTITGVTGINLLYSDTHTSGGSCLYWKKAVGDEDGDNFNVHVSAGSEDVVAYCVAIDDWDGITPPELSTVVATGNSNPNSGSLTPSWGALDTLWFSLFTSDEINVVSVWPTNYDDNRNNDQSGTNSLAYSTRELNAVSDDPSAYTGSISTEWAAWTVAIKPLVPLVDTSLLVRYYFDEAASGTGPTAVVDRSGNAYDLDDIDYDSPDGAYTEISGNRGLENSGGTVTGVYARHGIDDSSDLIRDALVGSKTCTFEIVLRVDVVVGDVSRIFVINDRSGSNADLGIVSDTADQYEFYFNGNASSFGGADLSARSVVHMVVDTAEATTADRIKFYVNGVLDDSIGLMTQDSTLSFSTGRDLIAFNRESSGVFDRAYDGVKFYAAVYSGALTPEQVFINNSVLQLSDDQPVVDLIRITNFVIPSQRYPKFPRLNPHHWQGQNLLSCWPLVGDNAIGVRDLTGYRHLSFDAAASTHPLVEANPYADAIGRFLDADGQYLRITDNDEGFDDLYCDQGYGAASNITFVVKVRGDFTSTRRYVCADFSSGSSDHFFYLRAEANNTWSVACVLATANGLIFEDGVYAADTDYTLGVTIDFAAEEMKLYINGTLITTDDFSAATGFDGSKGFQSNIGNFKGSSTTSTSSWRGRIWDFRIYRGVLSANQLLEIDRDPYKAYLPESIPIYPFSGAPPPPEPSAFRPRYSHIGFYYE